VQKNVAAVAPRPGEVDKLAPFRRVGHDWPEVDKPLTKRLLGTGAGVDPLQPEAGASRRLIDDFYGETSESVLGANLKRRVGFEADSKDSIRDGRESFREVPEGTAPGDPC
jgi:hypothetical protein